MKKIIVLSLILFAGLYTIKAQTANETEYEQKATELLKKASNKIKGFSSMKVDFTYTMENTQMDIKETMTGKILSKGDKYHMTVGENIFISDGETVWNFIDELYEIHINTLANTEGGLTPTVLLDNFENEYRGKFIRQEQHAGKTVDIIDLVPNTPQSFFKYRMALDALDQTLVYTIAYDRNGGTYTYAIDNLESNQSISDSKFVFDRSAFPDDADVVDMR